MCYILDMKIYCEKCNENIKGLLFQKLDKYEVGQITCPKCNKTQARYISESDILLHLGLTEIIYFILSISIIYVFKLINSILFSIIIIIALIVLGVMLLRYLDLNIYMKGHLKKELMNQKFIEDKTKISKANNWTFMLFMMVSIMFTTNSDGKLIFYLFSIGCIILTFVKYFLCIKNEKRSTSK